MGLMICDNCAELYDRDEGDCPCRDTSTSDERPVVKYDNLCGNCGHEFNGEDCPLCLPTETVYTLQQARKALEEEGWTPPDNGEY